MKLRQWPIIFITLMSLLVYANKTEAANNFVAMAAGAHHTCALNANGDVLCWGRNFHGQLGNGTFNDQPLPSLVQGLNSPAVAITAGLNHTCALLDNGDMQCWGTNVWGQLGIGSSATSVNTPTTVVGLTTSAVTISAGEAHTCAILSNGDVVCWGSNTFGQLGNDKGPYNAKPVEVKSLVADAIQVSGGSNHTCVLINDGNIMCWGQNSNGQLGDGTHIDRPNPTLVVGINNVTKISSGSLHNCAIKNDGSVYCWGDNTTGQLGDGTLVNRSSPTLATGLTMGAVDIDTSWASSCVLLAGIDKVACWGLNWAGQLGDGTTTLRLNPTMISTLPNGLMSIITGGDHACALIDDGRMYCWGDNGFDQLGANVNHYQSLDPVQVICPPPTVVSLANVEIAQPEIFVVWIFGLTASLTGLTMIANYLRRRKSTSILH